MTCVWCGDSEYNRKPCDGRCGERGKQKFHSGRFAKLQPPPLRLAVDEDVNHPMNAGEVFVDNIEMPTTSTGAKREKLHALPYDLVPFAEITEAYARVAEFGAKKYTPWNQTLGIPRVQILGSLLRHAFAYLRGEERDKESGLLHTDHILWNAATLSHNVHWDLEDGRRVEPPRDYKNKPENCLPR